MLASDGVFDVFENEDLRYYVRKMLSSNLSLEDIVRGILDESYSRGSMDNMTLTLIAFESRET